MFFIYLQQFNGCDYTLACGKMLIQLAPYSSKEEAVAAFKSAFLDKGSGYDVADRAELLEVVSVEKLPLTEWREERKAIENALELRATEEEERELLRRLKAKYEGAE